MDAEKISIDDLLNSIIDTDLVPSRKILMENIQTNFNKLKNNGIITLADLRKALKNQKNIESLSKKISIDNDYLVLLRREIESYFPKAFALTAFDWLDNNQILNLESIGFKNSALLYDGLESQERIESLIEKHGFQIDFINEIFNLVNLTRIQWVNPTFASMLLNVGFISPKTVARADAEELYNKLDSLNKKEKYFNGKIGLKDIKRLIKAASYVI